MVGGIQTTRYSYDTLGRVSAELQVETGRITAYAYDAGDNLFTLTDPAGNRTLYTYNARGELTAIQDPLAGFQRFRYSATGTLLEYEDQGGNTTTHTYDSLNRRTAETHGHGTTHFAQWSYDGEGNLLTAGNTTTGRRYTYDAAGRLILGTESLVGPTLFGADVVIDRVRR